MKKKKQVHNSGEVLQYWEENEVESMYDKNLLNLEIELIKSRIPKNSKILDAGCGEGEGTLVYSAIHGSKIHAVDFSNTRLKKAHVRLSQKKNVLLKKVDFLGNYTLDSDYSVVISQRFLINLMEWKLQKKVLHDLSNMLKKDGKLLLLEGSIKGVDELNEFRKVFELSPIPIKWHNLFFDDEKLLTYMKSIGMKFIESDGIGEYFVLTRGIRPYFTTKLNWSDSFNKNSASHEVKQLLRIGEKCSRLKLWVFKKVGNHIS